MPFGRDPHDQPSEGGIFSRLYHRYPNGLPTGGLVIEVSQTLALEPRFGLGGIIKLANDRVPV